jgi:hypothetical protein
LIVTEPSGDSNNVGEAPRRDGLLNFGAHLAITYKHQLKADSFSDKQRGRTEEEQLTLLDTQTTNAYESFAIRSYGTRAIQVAFVEAAMDNFDL